MVPSAPVPYAMERRRALLVATDTYEDPEFTRLIAPAGDAASLADVLGDPEVGAFDVTVVANGTADHIERALRVFLGDSRPDDTVLLYFSCHGVKDLLNRYYLAATDSRADRMPQTGLNPRTMHVWLDECDAKTVVVILDCCFSGAFRKGFVARGDAKVDLPRDLTGRGRIILTSSTQFQYSYEEGTDLVAGNVPRSVFTTALVDGIRTGLADRDDSGYVFVDDLYDYVHETLAYLGKPQSPEMYSDGRGRVWIARNRRAFQQRFSPPPVLVEGATVTGILAASVRHFPCGEAVLKALAATVGRLRGLAEGPELAVIWRDIQAAVDPHYRPTTLIDAVLSLRDALDTLNRDPTLCRVTAEVCDALIAQVADAESTAAVDDLLAAAVAYLALIDRAVTRYHGFLDLTRHAPAIRSFVDVVSRAVRHTGEQRPQDTDPGLDENTEDPKPAGDRSDPAYHDTIAVLVTLAAEIRAVAHVLRGLGGRGPLADILGELAAVIRSGTLVDETGAIALRALAAALNDLAHALSGFLDEEAVAALDPVLSAEVGTELAGLSGEVDLDSAAATVHEAAGKLVTQARSLGNVHELLAVIADIRASVAEVRRTPWEPEELTEAANTLAASTKAAATAVRESREGILTEARETGPKPLPPASEAGPAEITLDD
ncbi:caspase domain-containing protein [Streptomyces sp. NPDC058001]|uniref:caspase family protein n=1 Tax=Streptomyces sp. NPDC058001 TaxID=3346300 RepID=UPI0036E0E573